MNIALCSAFRDAAAYLPRYLRQVDALGQALAERGDRFAMVWGDGDSIDHTRERLIVAAQGIRWPVHRVDCTHGGARYGSVVNAERFRQLAFVGRQIFATVPAGADVVIYVESDLIWQLETMLGLIEHVKPPAPIIPIEPVYKRAPVVAAVAPMIILQRAGWQRGTWYDTHAFVADGVHFEHRPPWHFRNSGASTMIELETAGSCLAMRADYARAAVMDERVLMGMCEQFRGMGGSVWLDLALPAVIHE